MQEVTETVLRAVQQAGVRAILLEGLANLLTPHFLHPHSGSHGQQCVLETYIHCCMSMWW